MQFLPHIGISILLTLGMFLAHETGHALMANLFGARVVMFNVLGIQWYPTLEWLPELGFGGYVSWWAPPDQTVNWLIILAGSSFTLLLALLASIALSFGRTRGVAKTALVVVSFYFLDSLVKILPVIGFAPRGWNFRFIRSFSEAYYAALGLGIPSNLYIAAVILISFTILLLVARALHLIPSLMSRDTIQPHVWGV